MMDRRTLIFTFAIAVIVVVGLFAFAVYQNRLAGMNALTDSILFEEQTETTPDFE